MATIVDGLVMDWSSLAQAAYVWIRIKYDLSKVDAGSPLLVRSVHSPLILMRRLRGFANKQKFQKSEITREVGGWVKVSLQIFVVEILPKIALNRC